MIKTTEVEPKCQMMVLKQGAVENHIKSSIANIVINNHKTKFNGSLIRQLDQ